MKVVGFAGDGAFGISVNEMTACGRNDWPPTNMVIFHNYQWGAEKRNTTLWFDDNFVGTELNVGVDYAKVADACGLQGVPLAAPWRPRRAQCKRRFSGRALECRWYPVSS